MEAKKDKSKKKVDNKKDKSKGRSKIPADEYSDQIKRLDNLILHQIRFEAQTKTKFEGLLKMVTAFSKASWERQLAEAAGRHKLADSIAANKRKSKSSKIQIDDRVRGGSQVAQEVAILSGVIAE